MAIANPTKWYCGSTKWTAVTAWATGAVKAAGALVRQSATPTVNNERVFVCIVAGTTHATTEPTWTVTKGAKTTDNTVTWQEVTGQPAVNGDTANTPVWAASQAATLGQIIYVSSNSSLQICTTAGTTKAAPIPSFSATAGTTTTDNTATWTSLGVASGFGAWAAPHSRIKNAETATWMANGDTCWISSSHAETAAAALSQYTTGANNSPKYFISVNDSVAPPTAVLAGASVTTTGNNTITLGSGSGYHYTYGVSFSAGSGAVASRVLAGNKLGNFENCSFAMPGTTGGVTGNICSGGGDYNFFRNCSWTFGATSYQLSFRGGRAEIINGTFAATGSVPTTLFTADSGNAAIPIIRDSDLSNITGNLMTVSTAGSTILELHNCKVNASFTPTTGSISGPGNNSLRMYNCSSSTPNYNISDTFYEGTITQDTTTVNTGGSTDGTTNMSWKLVSTANSSFASPLICEQIIQWQDTTGSSKTATIEIAGAGTLTNAEIWMELEYAGSSSTPIGSTASSRVADLLATPANVTTSSASWNGSPAVKQKLQVTFTPQMKGPIKARIYLAKPSTTVYIDPFITVT
jgi:hypothetical protein